MTKGDRISRRAALGCAGAIFFLSPAALAQTENQYPAITPASKLVSYVDAAGQLVAIEALIRGEGPLVVMLPAGSRGASDFDDLASRIAAAGYRTAAVNPRGIGNSKGPRLERIADHLRDLVEVIEQLSPGGAPAGGVVVIGHAFGNRMARALASFHPQAVSSLILLAAGGQVAPKPEAAAARRSLLNPALSPEEQMAAMRIAYFAQGNSPEAWRLGWHRDAGADMAAALRKIPADSWVGAGKAPLYVIQGAEDNFAPPANSEALKSAYPDRVGVATLANAGHQMLAEQPERLAELVIARLNKLK